MRRLLTVLVLACAVAGLPAPALAHNVLVGSDPKDGATLSSAPDRITLVFDQPARKGYAQVSVTGPDGASHVDGEAVVAAEKVSVKVEPLPANGAYTVGYRVLSADGHPITGKITFTLKAVAPATTGQPVPGPTPSTGAGQPVPPTSGGQPVPETQVPTTAPDGATASDALPADEAQRAEAYEAAANGGAGMAVVWIVGALLVLAAGTAVALRRSRPSPAPYAVPTLPGEDTAATPPGQGTAATPPDEGATATRPGDGTAAAPPDEGTGATRPADGTAAVRSGEGTGAVRSGEGTGA
ncbi:copper resistance CopC family protein [Nonomuraea indica]|uniref:copper resistance CopC family protein n=1 Tax=Nonomuraea indica TaxID=1581193 RepID=UPI000C79B2A6|nr:copper resistance CopC family protein [Nonomuraea indica]